MKKYKNYIICVLIIISFCISVCFIPIDATRFVPQVEKQFAQELGINVHIEKLIFRFGPSLKIKAPVMHLMYVDGQKFGQLDNVKFFVPWSTLFKDEVAVNRIYADKFIVKTSSKDKYLSQLFEKLDSKEYDMYPNLQLKNYNIGYKDVDKNKIYAIKGTNLELTKLDNFKNLKVVSEGDFYIDNTQYIKYNLSITPNIEADKNYKTDISLREFVDKVEDLEFHADIMADLKLYNNFDNELQISGLANIDNISVLDKDNKNPKSFIYLTFLGNKTGILSNIYATQDKKIYAQGVINNSKKPEFDLKVKTDEIKLSDVYSKLKLFVDCSKYKVIDKIDGTMLADFTVKGDLKKIKSNGFLKINNAFIKAGKLCIKDINSDVDFSNNIITITNAAGYVNSAPIVLRGTFNKNLDMELLMSKVPLTNLFPDSYGIEKGIISLNAKISGNPDNIIHKENIQIENFKATRNNNSLTFDSLKVDTNKENVAYISNILLKPEKTEFIKLPLVKVIIDNNNIRIPDTNIFMPNSKVQAKAEITDYNNANMIFSISFDGFINSKDLSGFTKTSGIYPIKLNIGGTKESQTIEGQVHIIKAMLLNEPSLINLSAKIDNNILKLDDFSLSAFNDNFSNNLKSNLKNNKKIIITGSIENFKQPTLKNIRVFIPQPVNLNVNDIVAQLKCDIFANGSINNPEIVGQLSVQNLVASYFQLVANNLTAEFNKNIVNINAPVLKIDDMSAGLNATVSTDFTNELKVKNINIKSKYLNTDTVLMYKDKLVSSLPISIEEGKLYSERLSASLYNSSLYLAAFNTDFSLFNNVAHINNMSAEAYNGKLAGKIDFNLRTEQFNTNIQGRGISAAPIFDVITPHKDSVSGVMDFDSSLQGNLSSKESLNGSVKFDVRNGHMGTLGKLEHLLYAQNVIADNMLRTSLSVVTKAITLKDTGLFKYLRGDIELKNGVANIKMLQSQGPLMALFIKGQYYPSNDYAKLVVLGRLSDEIVSGLGSFGEFSINKLMIMLTGDDNKLNIKVDDIDKLPQLPMKNTKEFRTVINGILEKPSSVITFNWISYSQKSLKQREVPSSNEKLPDFIESLPY